MKSLLGPCVFYVAPATNSLFSSETIGNSDIWKIKATNMAWLPEPYSQLKFRYSEEAKNWGKISHFVLTLISNFKKSGRLFQILWPSHNI